MANKIETIAPTETLVVDTSAYASGDLIGKHTNGYLTFANVCDIGGGKIQTVRLTDQAKQAGAIDLVLFKTALANSTLTDNGALDVHDTDLLDYIGHVSFVAGSYAAFADNNAAILRDLNLYFTPKEDRRDIYGVLVARGAITFAAATDLRVSITVERE